MTKKMIAVLPLICVLVFAMGGSGSAPTAASTTPSVTAPTAPAMGTPTDPGWGTCRYYCGSKSYPTASQCAANCPVACEVIC